MLQHKHILMGLDVKTPPRDSEEAVAFLKFLIKRVDMQIAKAESLVVNPHGYYCDIPGNEGVTATGILETSHCAIHSWNLTYPGKFQFDLYSCKDFDISYVISLCNAFEIIKGSYLLVDRNTELDVLEKGILGENGVITKVLVPQLVEVEEAPVGRSVSDILKGVQNAKNPFDNVAYTTPISPIAPTYCGGEV